MITDQSRLHQERHDPKVHNMNMTKPEGPAYQVWIKIAIRDTMDTPVNYRSKSADICWLLRWCK